MVEALQQSFLGRQPILDRDRKTVAYELLFRHAADAEHSVFLEVSKASIQVIATAFSSMGVDAVLGDCCGFFNIAPEILMTDMIEALPRERVVLEILETTDATDETARRCRELRDRGFVIALDDYVPGDHREPMLDDIDMVKVDILGLGAAKLEDLVRSLERRPLQLLAEKVETRDEFDLCRSLGFDLFQGYFFARPVVLEHGSMESGRVTLLELLRHLSGDGPWERAIDTLKRDVSLGTSLLRLVNSVGLPALTKINRIEDAFRYIGPRRLQCWVAILLFAGEDGAGGENPLFQLASRRGKLMESVIARSSHGANRDGASRAFLVGMFSLLDTLLATSIEQAIADLNLDTQIERALIARAGPLGRLLGLVERIERFEEDDFEPIAAGISEFGLTMSDLQEIDHEIQAWIDDLAVEHRR